jgi:hypothetical protein
MSCLRLISLALAISATARAETRDTEAVKGAAGQSSKAIAFDERRLASADDDRAPDGAVLCPGQPTGENKFCDCTDPGDCNEDPDGLCFCEAARECCGFKPSCVDMPKSKWTYDAGKKGDKGCSHIANGKKEERKKRCKQVGSNGATGNEACPKACGICEGKSDSDDDKPKSTPVPTSTPRCDGDPFPDKKGYKAPGPFVVSWHVWDHAEGMGFETLKQAERCYNKYDSSSWAARLYDNDLKILEEYGNPGSKGWKEVKKWAKDFIKDSTTIEDSESCKDKKGEDGKWYYKKKSQDCKWAKKNNKCSKEGKNKKGKKRTGYESCCKSCKS